MNKPNKTELEYFIRYSLDSDKYKRYMELYDEIERLNKCYCNRSDCAGRLNQKNEVYDSVVQRNEKAIEYIEKNCILSDTWKDLDFCNFVPIGKIKYKPLPSKKVKKLLDILKGDDKE